MPVIAKEVGNGIGAGAARRLAEAGVWAIDVAGAGGTSWSEVERFRHSDCARRARGGGIRRLGHPTTEAIRQVRAALPDIALIGSGGVRSGVDIAKAIALGADHCRHRQAGAWPCCRRARRSGGDRRSPIVYQRAADRDVL